MTNSNFNASSKDHSDTPRRLLSDMYHGIGEFLEIRSEDKFRSMYQDVWSKSYAAEDGSYSVKGSDILNVLKNQDQLKSNIEAVSGPGGTGTGLSQMRDQLDAVNRNYASMQYIIGEDRMNYLKDVYTSYNKGDAGGSYSDMEKACMQLDAYNMVSGLYRVTSAGDTPAAVALFNSRFSGKMQDISTKFGEDAANSVLQKFDASHGTSTFDSPNNILSGLENAARAESDKNNSDYFVYEHLSNAAWSISVGNIDSSAIRDMFEQRDHLRLAAEDSASKIAIERQHKMFERMFGADAVNTMGMLYNAEKNGADEKTRAEISTKAAVQAAMFLSDRSMKAVDEAIVTGDPSVHYDLTSGNYSIEGIDLGTAVDNAKSAVDETITCIQTYGQFVDKDTLRETTQKFDTANGTCFSDYVGTDFDVDKDTVAAADMYHKFGFDERDAAVQKMKSVDKTTDRAKAAENALGTFETTFESNKSIELN